MTFPLGLESGVVRLVDYDPRWAELHQAEASRLLASISPLPLTLEHIGSTAVPGLCAKPVLDILAGYHHDARLPEYISAISDAGYIHRGEQGIPGRQFFRRGVPRAYHLHLTRLGSSFWVDHLAFRDILRDDPAARDEYARLKRALAERYPTDRESYIEGKGPFVRDRLGAALRRPETHPR
jgi:GrpB-like predicted nucleotidyltransferase (UPF0157 family)